MRIRQDGKLNADLDKHLQLGGDPGGAGDGASSDELCQGLGVAVHPWGGCHEAPAAEEGQEDLPHGHIEADGRLLQEHVMGA